MSKHIAPATLACLAALLTTAAVAQPAAGPAQRLRQAATTTTHYGPTRAIGAGSGRSYVVMDTQGHPISIGFTLTEGALTGLPAGMQEHVLPLPAQAAGKTPFDHISVDWMPHGHVPPGIYDVPHFDFHFYMMTLPERDAITGVGENIAIAKTPPDARFLPPGFIADTRVEPRMGVHWVSGAAPEFHGQPFTHTFIYGFFGGTNVFLEPMATLAFLQTRPNVTTPIPQPSVYPREGYYPTQYSIQYNPWARAYDVSLDGMAARAGL